MPKTKANVEYSLISYEVKDRSSWPSAKERTGFARRIDRTRIKTSIQASIEMLDRHIRMMKAHDARLTYCTNNDSFAVLRFRRQENDVNYATYAVDNFTTPEACVHAITQTIGAMRVIEMNAGEEMVTQLESGLPALPAPASEEKPRAKRRSKPSKKRSSKSDAPKRSSSEEKPWHEVLGVSENAAYSTVNKKYRALMNKLHPDRCKGEYDREKFLAVQSAYTEYTAMKQKAA